MTISTYNNPFSDSFVGYDILVCPFPNFTFIIPLAYRYMSMKRLDGFDQFTAAGRKPRAGKEKSNWR